MSEVISYNCRHGIFSHFSSDNLLRVSLERYGEWAEEEIAFLGACARTGSTVLDVGANIGTHAIALAKIVGPQGKIWAIEAQPDVYTMLCHNIVANGLTSFVKPVQALAGKSLALVPFFEDIGGPRNYGARNFYNEMRSTPANGHIHLPAITLDSLPIANCSLIKIDVESMELEVLTGALTLIARDKPVIYFEHNSHNAELLRTVSNLLRTVGAYRLFWHFPNVFNRNNFNNDQTNIFGGATEMYIVAVNNDHPAVEGLVEIVDFDEPPCRPSRDEALLGTDVKSFG